MGELIEFPREWQASQPVMMAGSMFHLFVGEEGQTLAACSSIVAVHGLVYKSAALPANRLCGRCFPKSK